VNDRIVVEEVYCGHEALLELLFRGYADVAQDRTGELGEETLDEVACSKLQIDEKIGDFGSGAIPSSV
jgi:hypothetical protein